MRVVASAGLIFALVGLAGCSGDVSSLDQAEAQVAVKEKAVTQAESDLAAASEAFCESSKTYIVALDQYGDVLNATAPTVGDVQNAGSDLLAPRDDAFDGAEDAVAAQQALVTAQQELADANAALETIKSGASASPVEASKVPTPEPLAAEAVVDRVKQANDEFNDAMSSLTAQTPLREATETFNSAALALEIAWLQLFVNAGCASDGQAGKAQEAVVEYTLALQQDLKDAGFYQGAVDGVYGPETVAAVQALQEAYDLPVTGTVDKVTALALHAELVKLGIATEATTFATTAALQQTLKVLGMWDEPIDGIWTDELTDALKELQTALEVEPTGELDVETLTAFNEALAEVYDTSPSPSPSPTPSASPSASPSVTASVTPLS